MASHHLYTEPGPPVVLSADPFRFMLSAASEPLLGTGNLLSLGTVCLESVYFSDPPFCGLAGCPPVLPGSRPQVPVVPDPVGLSLPAPVLIRAGDTAVPGQLCGHGFMHSCWAPGLEGPHTWFDALLLLKFLIIFEHCTLHFYLCWALQTV